MKLIDKDKVVAEIKRIEHETNYEPFTDEVLGKRCACRSLLSFIDTLEVKDVDLEKEFDDYIAKQNAFTNNDNSEIKYYNGDSFNHVYDIYPIAKHFFELGLKSTERRIV